MAPATPDGGTISGLTLFKGLPARELERLTPLMHERSFPPQGERPHRRPARRGRLRASHGLGEGHLLTTEGTEVILAILGAGELVGELSAADSLGRSADVVTLEETTFLWMDRITFRSSVEGSTVLACNLAESLS